MEEQWPAAVALRPGHDAADTGAYVRDFASGGTYRTNPRQLAERLLAADGEAAAAAAVTGVLAERGHAASELVRSSAVQWWERGWHPSLELYLASRQVAFADARDEDGHIRTATVRRYLDQDGPPPHEPIPGPRTALGEPPPPGEAPLDEVLLGRRTVRAFAREAVALEVLSGLLWHGFGAARRRRRDQRPDEPLSYLDSAGTAWEPGVCVYGVDGLAPGPYRYDVDGHALVLRRAGDHRQRMVEIYQGLRPTDTAAFTLGLICDFEVYHWRYRHDHALRRLYVESGMIAQDLIVLGRSYGVETFVTPAQRDGDLLELFDMDRRRYGPIYTLTMGHRTSTGNGWGS